MAHKTVIKCSVTSDFHSISGHLRCNPLVEGTNLKRRSSVCTMADKMLPPFVPVTCMHSDEMRRQTPGKGVLRLGCGD